MYGERRINETIERERRLLLVVDDILDGKITCICRIPTDFIYLAHDIKRATKNRIRGHITKDGKYCCPHFGNTCGEHKEYGPDKGWYDRLRR